MAVCVRSHHGLLTTLLKCAPRIGKRHLSKVAAQGQQIALAMRSHRPRPSHFSPPQRPPLPGHTSNDDLALPLTIADHLSDLANQRDELEACAGLGLTLGSTRRTCFRGTKLEPDQLDHHQRRCLLLRLDWKLQHLSHHIHLFLRQCRRAWHLLRLSLCRSLYRTRWTLALNRYHTRLASHLRVKYFDLTRVPRTTRVEAASRASRAHKPWPS